MTHFISMLVNKIIYRNGTRVLVYLLDVEVCTEVLHVVLLFCGVLHSKNGFVVITTMYVKCSAGSQELGYTS